LEIILEAYAVGGAANQTPQDPRLHLIHRGPHPPYLETFEKHCSACLRLFLQPIGLHSYVLSNNEMIEKRGEADRCITMISSVQVQVAQLSISIEKHRHASRDAGYNQLVPLSASRSYRQFVHLQTGTEALKRRDLKSHFYPHTQMSSPPSNQKTANRNVPKLLVRNAPSWGQL
jgi:hypothetical protein